MPLRNQHRRRGELGCLPATGISAQLGHLLRPLASPLEELTGSLCSLILMGRARKFLGQPLPFPVPIGPAF